MKNKPSLPKTRKILLVGLFTTLFITITVDAAEARSHFLKLFVKFQAQNEALKTPNP